MPAGVSGTLVASRSLAVAAILAATLIVAWASPTPQDAGKDRKPPRRPVPLGPEDKKRRDFNSDCLTSGCHARLNKTPWVHAPVAVGACDACHVATGKPAEHKFRSPRPKESLCGHCHWKPDRKDEKKFTHKAYLDGDCNGCHDPHGGTNKELLKTQDASKMCGSCHKPHQPGKPPPDAKGPAKSPAHLDVSFPYLHPPFAEKKCLDCHRSHESDHEKLLTMPERQLCLKCHSKVAESLGRGPHVHTPVKTACRTCHATHGGKDQRMLHKEPPELCLSCHEKVTATVAGHTAHGALAGKDSCLHCHTTAHTSETENFVPEPVATACYKCHAEELTTPAGKKIANVKAEIDAAKFKHGPVAKGECRGCHLSHSSPYRKLLSKKFTDKMYAEFAEPSFALCFSCHDKRVVTDERTALTSFRDGDRNLHHLHVNRKKGRTCGVCHEAHGSSQEGLIRESVPFGPGGWKLPIRFKKTPKGGTCASGCHQPLSYDNTKPPVDRKAHLLPAPTPLGRGGGTPPGGKSPKE